MFGSMDENKIIEQSDLFPRFVDGNYLKGYALYAEGLTHLRNLLDYNFILNDYTITPDFILLKIDKKHIENLGEGRLTHQLEDDDPLEGWFSFKYFVDEFGNLRYETFEDGMEYEI